MIQVTDLEHQASCGLCGASAGRQEKLPEYKRLMIEFVKILDDVPIVDQLRLKLMMLAYFRKKYPRLVIPVTAVFMEAEHRQPLMIGMKAGNGYEGREAPAATSET